MHRFDLVDPRKLWKSYLLALSVLFVLITSSHFPTMFFGGDSARVVEDVNMSGRQRMLSQRILYFSALYKKHGFADLEAMENLENALVQFITSHETLVSEATRKLPPAARDIYFGETGPQLDATSRRFADATETMLSGDDNARLGAYFYMRDIGADQLLRDLNAAVSAFELAGRQQAHRAEMWGYFGYGLALLALLLEAVFIFRPAHRTIVKAVDTLEENNDQLKQQEAEAFAALEDAEDAWVEAEHARKQVESLMEATQDHASALRKELAVFMTASRGLLASVNGSELTEAQNHTLTHVQRLSSAAHDMVREFTDCYALGTQDTREKDVVFALSDVTSSVLAALAYYQAAQKIHVSQLRDLSEAPKISGQPTRYMRIMVGAVLATLRASQATVARIDLAVETAHDAPQSVFRVLIDQEHLITGDTGEALSEGLHEILVDLCREITGEEEGDRPEISLSFSDGLVVTILQPVTLPAARVLRPRKPVRQVRKAPGAS